MRYVLILSAIMMVGSSAMAKKKTVLVIPEKAKIFLNGAEVGNGSYVVDFRRGMDFVILKFEMPGYITKTVRLFKDNPKNTVSYTLTEDEAMLNSVGAEDGVDYANRYFSVTVKKDMNEDETWKRLVSIAINNFENVEIRDKSAGWIRSGWVVRKFPLSEQAVRTRMEIKIQFVGDDEVSYRVRLQSQIADMDCGYSDQCFHTYDRLLKHYTEVISELQTTLGSNF